MTTTDQITVLQQRLADAERARLRAEGARDAAIEAHQRIMAELHEKFGVMTLEEAEELLRRLHGEIQQWVDEINTNLDRIGA